MLGNIVIDFARFAIGQPIFKLLVLVLFLMLCYLVYLSLTNIVCNKCIFLQKDGMTYFCKKEGVELDNALKLRGKKCPNMKSF